jgi:hypothetical protein
LRVRQRARAVSPAAPLPPGRTPPPEPRSSAHQTHMRRAGDDDWHRERQHDARHACASQRRPDSLADSHRRDSDERRSEPRRDSGSESARLKSCPVRQIATRGAMTRHDRPPHRNALPGACARRDRESVSPTRGQRLRRRQRRPAIRRALNKHLTAASRDARRRHPRNRRDGAWRLQCSQRCDGLQPAGKDALWLCTWSGPRRSRRRATAPLHNQPSAAEHERAGCGEHNLGTGDARMAGAGGADAGCAQWRGQRRGSHHWQA